MPEEKEDEQFFKVTPCESSHGKTLFLKENLETGEKNFVGRINIMLEKQMPNGQVMMQQIGLNFPIEADSVMDAFGKFEEIADEEATKAKAKIRSDLQNKIVMPNGSKLPNIPNMNQFRR